MENLSGAEEADRYFNEKLCIYCGKKMKYYGGEQGGDDAMPCCGELHFATEAEIDDIEESENVSL